MPLSWKLFRIVCVLQMVTAAFAVFTSVINLFNGIIFSDIARFLLFLLVMLLAIFAVNLLNNNYPDTPVAGTQKKQFNRLFLLNFIFLAFLFGFVIAEYKAIHLIAVLLRKPVISLHFSMLVTLLIYLLTLIFQIIILFGLFILRRLLYINFLKQKFEFETSE